MMSTHSLLPFVDRMFCDKTLAHQDDLVPHILAEHPTMSPKPNVVLVEAEFKMPGEMPSLPVKKEEVLRCLVCGHIAQGTRELESHVRKHKEYYTHLCQICGRQFKEARYLKNHMKKHPKEGGKGKGQQEVGPPVTINGVPQEPSAAAFSPYKMCLACGLFYPDQESLDKHSIVHNRQAEPDKEEEWKISQEIFLGGLTLRPVGSKSDSSKRKSTWIPQLNPVVSHQAWNLATTGNLAVSVKNPKVHSASKIIEDSASDKAKVKGQGGQSLKEMAGKGPCPQKPVAQSHCTPPKNGEEGPVSAVQVKQLKAVSPRQGEEGPKEAVEGTLASDEKPYKCVHCDFAAARKTALNCHVQRRHKGQPLDQHQDQALDQALDLSVCSSTKRKLESDEENPVSKRRHPTGRSPDGRFNSVCGKFDNPPVLVKTEYNALPPTEDGHLRYPSPPHLEKVGIQSEISDEPLDLSLTTPASAESKFDVFPFSCPHCHYSCIIHWRLFHMYKPDTTERNRTERLPSCTGREGHCAPGR